MALGTAAEAVVGEAAAGEVAGCSVVDRTLAQAPLSGTATSVSNRIPLRGEPRWSPDHRFLVSMYPFVPRRQAKHEARNLSPVQRLTAGSLLFGLFSRGGAP